MEALSSTVMHAGEFHLKLQQHLVMPGPVSKNVGICKRAGLYISSSPSSRPNWLKLELGRCWAVGAVPVPVTVSRS